MNLRTLAGPDRPYHAFNREERHLAAILFYVLNLPGNTEHFLSQIDCAWTVKEDEFGIYFEYSYLRDWWDGIGKGAGSNERKRDSVLGILRRQGVGDDTIDKLSSCDTQAFNQFFIGLKGASAKAIQSPANWRLERIAESLANGDLIAACKLKWAFKIKPDIVIHTDVNHAICLELKLESGFGSYPSAASEKALLREMGLFGENHTRPFPIGQIDMQKYMFELLGLDCRQIMVSRGHDNGREEICWERMIGAFDTTNVPGYMQAALRNATKSVKIE
jgi:hypothetical protein